MADGSSLALKPLPWKATRKAHTTRLRPPMVARICFIRSLIATHSKVAVVVELSYSFSQAEPESGWPLGQAELDRLA